MVNDDVVVCFLLFVLDFLAVADVVLSLSASLSLLLNAFLFCFFSGMLLFLLSNVLLFLPKLSCRCRACC